MVTDAEGLATTVSYDGLENLTAQSSHDTGLTQFTHDDAGNRLTQLDARGALTSFLYDALKQRHSITATGSLSRGCSIPVQALAMQYPTELYAPSTRPYRGLDELDYPVNLSGVFAGQPLNHFLLEGNRVRSGHVGSSWMRQLS